MNTSPQRGPKQMPIVIPPIVPLRVLVVDDSRSFGDLAVALLEREPSVDVVGIARSGAEALESVVALQPDVVLMDVQMSPMSGLTAASLIRWMFPQSSVVMMSSDDSPRLRAECVASGAAAFIHKPQFIAEFLTAVGPIVRDVVSRRRFAVEIAARNQRAVATAR